MESFLHPQRFPTSLRMWKLSVIRKAHLSEAFIITGGLLEGAFEIKLCFLSRCFSAGLWLSKVWDRPSVKSCKAPRRSPCMSLCGCPSPIYTCHTSPPFYTHFSAYNLKLRQFSCHPHSRTGSVLMSQMCVASSPWLVITKAGELSAFDSVHH